MAVAAVVGECRALVLGDVELALEDGALVMGVINLSPESRNRDTFAGSVGEAVAMAGRYREWGASLVDVGGQSSHYEAPTLEDAEEMARVVPAVEALRSEGHLVAIDTWKPEVARAAVEAGAAMVNDTGGMSDPEMRRLVSSAGVAAVAVYVEGRNPHEVGEVEIREDKAGQIADHFRALLPELAGEGIENLVLDPGIAVNYRGDYREYSRQQIEVIAGLGRLRELGRPVLVPVPRKREAHRVAAYIALALEHGADILRAHDVEMACDLVALFGPRR